MPTLAPLQTPPPAAPVPGIVQAQSIEGLQLQVTQLSQQLVALRAQRDVLRRRINTMPSNEVRAELQAQRLQLDAQVVQVEMQVEAAKAQLGARLGIGSSWITSTGGVVVQTLGQRSVDPDMVVGMSFALLIAVAFPLSVAYARRIWRAKPADAPPARDESASRLERVEHAVDAIAIEIERVAEGQRFVTKVFAERPAAPVVVPQMPVAAERPDAALGDVKPLLALGAGPMEPIRAAERQTVRQSITPH